MKKRVLFVMLIVIVAILAAIEIPDYGSYCRIVHNGLNYRLQERSIDPAVTDTTWVFLKGVYNSFEEAKAVRQKYLDALKIYYEENFTEWEEVPVNPDKK